MKSKSTFFNSIKSTLLSGIFFLIPLMLIFYGIGKLKSLMGDIAAVVYPQERVETILGIFLINAFAVTSFFMACLVVGLIVKHSFFKNLRHALSDFVVKIFPAYEFFKAYAEDLVAVDKSGSGFIPVLVDLGSNSRVGFQVDLYGDGQVAVYLPGTPNPWSGSISYIDSSKCKALPVSFHDAVVYCRAPGNKHTKLAVILRELKA